MFMNDRRKRVGALALLLVFVLTMLLSSAFIFTHTAHTHDHSGPKGSCAVCMQLAIAQNLLKNIVSVILVLAAVPSALLILLAIVYAFSCKLGMHTPISLKTRLNN